MTHTFVLKENKNGTRKIAGLGGFFSQSLYQASYQFSEWFFKDIFSFLTYKNVKNCSEYFQKNVDFF